MDSPHSTTNHAWYVLGFAFSHTMKSVVLIEKQRPVWQAGKLNGVGGKMERGEHPVDAMVREFYEETGCAVPYGDWHRFEVMNFLNGAHVVCFTTVLPEGAEIQTMEQERVDAYPVDDFGYLMSELDVIPNLHWLIPKAFHQMKEPPHERMIP